MNKSDRIRKNLLICFYAVFSFVMLFISVISLRFPLYYLVWWKMIIATAVFGAVFFGIMMLWNKIPEKLSDSKTIFIIALVIEVILIWTVSLIHGKDHFGVGDYFIVYYSAEEMASGADLTYYNYFMVYGNNTLPMLMLSALLRFARLIHVDTFYFMLTITTSLIVLSFLSAYELLKGYYKKIVIPMLVFLMICLPVYVFAGTFYTDSMTFGAGLISLALLKISIEKKAKYLIPIASLFAVWGICFKITSFIPILGAAIVLFVFGISKEKTEKDKKNKIICILVYSLIIILLLGIVRIIASQNPVYTASKEKSNPLTAWIAMGMTKNGSYSENVEFSDSINNLSTQKEKSDLALKYIKENLPEALSISHIVKKTQNNFASGMFSCFDYTCPDENGSMLYKLLDPGGTLYGRSCQYTFCYVLIIYIAVTYGSIRSLILLIKRRDKASHEILSFPKVFADISMFGIIVFLMLWESNNRQLYNQLPLLIMMLFVNTYELVNSVKKNNEKK